MLNLESISPSGSGTEVAYAPASGGMLSASVVTDRSVNTAGTTDSVTLSDAISTLNHYMDLNAPSLQFLIDQSSGQPIVKVMDVQTHQLLFQLPSGKALEMARNLDQLPGMLLRQKA